MKTSLAALLLLAFVSIAPNPALADNTMTAQNLLRVCTTADMDWINFCNGFFQAVHDQQASAGKVCAPKGTSRTTLVETYEANASVLIERDPSAGDRSAVEIAGKILALAYPCN